MKPSLVAIAHSARLNLWLFIGLNAVTTGIVAGLDVVIASLFALCLSLLASFGFISNDIIDRKIDTTIHPDRLAFVSASTIRLARMMMWALLLVALAIAWFLGTNAILVVGSLAISLGAYSLVLRKQLFIATIVCAYSVTSPIWAPFLVAGIFIPPYQLALAIVAFVIVSARETIMDLIDIEGDRIGGRDTIATLMGERVSIVAATVLTSTAILILLVVCIWRSLTMPLIGAVAIAAGIVTVGWLAIWPTVRLITNQEGKQVLHTFIRQTRWAMALLPLFIIVDWLVRG
jgi:4-hydroxybenzoate polyprenyltransferase